MSSTVIDSLLVTLGLDPSKFKQGVKDTEKDLEKINKAGKKTGTEVEDMGKKSAQAISKIRSEVLSLGAAFIGMSAIKSFIADVTRADSATGRMSANVGMSSQTMTTWQNVAERMGVSASEIAGDFESMAQAAMRFKLTGQGGEQFQWLRSLGLQMTNARGELKKGDEFDLEVAEKMDALKAAGKSRAELRTYLMGAGFGSGHADMLLTGADSLRKRAADSAPYAITDEDIKNARELQDAWNLMAEAAGRVGRDIKNAVQPILIAVLEFIRDNMKIILPLGLALTATMTALSALKFVSAISGITSLGAALTGTVGTAGKLMAIMGRMGLLGAVGVGAYELGTALGLGTLGEKLGLSLGDLFGSDPMVAGGFKKGASGASGPSRSANAPSGSSGALFASLERQYGLPAGLLDSMWAQESGRGRNMRSSAGAKGHFQFMDATAKSYGLKNPDDLTESAGAAARMMYDLLHQYHNLGDALTAYNGGGNAVRRFHSGSGSNETMRYAPQIMGRMGGGGGGSTTDVKTGPINIYTQATDAKGIARDIDGALQNLAFATQANVGMQ